MSKRKVYLNWANSVLAETGREVEGISSIQEGQVLCQLIDILCPEACLLQKLQALGSSQLPEMYIQTALDHMRKYGIKLNFSSQDILDGDIKSMLDVLWLIILNYGIHTINAYCDDFNTRRNAHQRSVGIGKKLLLEWCQRQLNTDFDSRNTLTYNLCTGDWFVKLLTKFANVSTLTTEDKVEQLKIAIDSIERQYSIKSSIINPSDIIDGTVDEHTLMIYVSLLQRKVDGNSLIDDSSLRSDRKNTADETSEWFSTSNGFGSDPQLNRIAEESEKSLAKTVIDITSGRLHEEDKLRALSGSTSYDSRERILETESSSHSYQVNGNHEPRSKGKLTSNTVQSSSPLRRPRDHKTIMAEAKEKLEEQRRRREEEDQNIREKEKKLKDTESKKADSSTKIDSARSTNDDVEEIPHGNIPFTTYPSQYLPGLGRGVPIVVMPGENPEMMFLLQALRQARHEANFHDQDSSSKTSSEETLPKGSKLLDLDSVDDIPPSEYLQFEHDRKSEVSTPRSVSPRRSEYVPSPEFLPAKKSVIDVVGNPQEPQTNVVDFPTIDKGDEKRYFPRVEIKEDVKVRIEMKRDKSDERISPRREKSPRPLSPGYDYIEDTISINDRETVPKTILKKPSNYGSSNGDSSYDRARERSQSPRHDRALSDSRLHTRSPREQMERDRSLSGDRVTSGRSVSPKSPRSPRHKSPHLDKLNENYQRIQSANDQNKDFSPGRNVESTDPNSRLVKVFHQELELLRMKMEMLEKSHIPNEGDLEDLNSLTQRLSEKIKERLSHRSRSPRSPRSPRHRSTSPDNTRSRLYRRRGDDGQPTESRSLSENRMSGSSDRRSLSSAKAHSLHDLPADIDKSLTVDDDGKLLYSPRSKSKPITLGYSSPIRKVSDEIWGMNEEEFAGVTNVQKEKWKKLTNSRDISDSDIVELKHALGTVIAENDILQAKLRNANTDINEKMKKTGDVLNDCRHHLSKAQAENMELRTQLEKERTRNESLEARMRDVEKEVKSIKATNSELESELEQTRNLLKGSSKKDIPTMQSLAEERDNLVEVLGTTQTENERLREELERAQKYAIKAQNTIGDLKTIVDDARKERQQLFDEISRLQSEGHLQTITGIIKRYVDKGLYLEVEPLNGYKIPSRSTSPVTKERLSRSVDSAIASRSRSESGGSKTPTKQLETPGSKSPRSRSESNPRLYNELSRSYQEPSRQLELSKHSVQESSQRSYSPVRRSLQEPVMTSSPVKSSYGRVNGMTIPVTPVVNDIISDDDDDDDDDFEDEGIEGFHYNYEDISPAITSELREIYPHRRTRSYRNNFTNSFDEGRISPTVDDIEVNRIFSRNPARLDFNDTNDSYNRSRSPRRDDNFSVSYDRSKSPGRLEMADLYEMKKPVRQQTYNIYGKNNIRRPVSRSESPAANRYSEQRNLQQKAFGGKSGEINNRLFIAALDNAVHEEGPKKYFDDNDIPVKDSWQEKNERLTSSYGPVSSNVRNSVTRTQNGGVRGILKNTKSEQNFQIKHGISSPLHRSVLERSVSPAKTPPNRDITNNKPSKLANSSVASNKTLGKHSNASSGKPLFSAASKMSGIVRNPNDLFADVSLSPVRTTSPSKYQHTPLLTVK